jgi:hypothetical protein
MRDAYAIKDYIAVVELRDICTVGTLTCNCSLRVLHFAQLLD